MSNGHNRLLYGSVGSRLVNSTLTLYTTCCRREISVSHALRLERNRLRGLSCCINSQLHPQPDSISSTSKTDILTNDGEEPADNKPPAWVAERVLPSAHNMRVQAPVGRRTFHTTSGTPFYSSHVGNASAPPRTPPKKPTSSIHPPRPSLPSKPASPLLPPKSTLSSSPKLARPPSAFAIPPVRNEARAGNVQISPLSLPNSPLQARQRDEEEARRVRQRAEEELRRVAHEKSRLAQAKLEKARQFLALQKKKQEELDNLRQSWKRKLDRAWEVAGLIESFGDRTGIDKYLRIHSLVARGLELERRERELYEEDGPSGKTREIGNRLRYDVADVFDAYEAWLWERGSNHDHIELHSESKEVSSWVNVRMDYIVHLRAEMLQTGAEFAALLHGLRQVERIRLQITLCPETFSYHKLSFPLEYLAEMLSAGAVNISKLFLTFHDLTGLFHKYGSRQMSGIEMRQKFTNYINRLRGSTRLAMVSLRHISIIPASFPQNQTLINLQPVLDSNTHWHVLRAKMFDMLENAEFELSQGHTSRFKPWRLKILREIQSTLADSQREIRLASDMAWLWMGIRIVSSGVRERSNRTSVPVLDAVAESATDSILTLGPTSPPVNSNDLPVSRHHDSLYPIDTALPIHYVTSLVGLYNVLPLFEGCDVIGFDSVRAHQPVKHHVVDFVIMASDHEVAIVHLSLISIRQLNLALPFADVLSNPRILKVGANVEHQRPFLVDGAAIELQGVLDFRDGADDHPQGSTVVRRDHNGRALSSMAARIMGSHLPALALHSTLEDLPEVLGRDRIRKIRAVTPLQVFTCKSDSLRYIPMLTQVLDLASRAYAALRIYRTVVSKTTQNHSKSSFGPILLHDPADSDRLTFRERQRILLQRMEYLRSMAERLAEDRADRWDFHTSRGSVRLRKIRKAATDARISRLTAYYLFTTFNEDLEHIGRIMGIGFRTFDERVQDMPSRKGQVAIEILAIAFDANLPLRPQDSDLLSYWSKFSTVQVSALAQAEESAIHSVDLGVQEDAEFSERSVSPVRLRKETESVLLEPQASTTGMSSKKPLSRFADLSASSTSEAPFADNARQEVGDTAKDSLLPESPDADQDSSAKGISRLLSSSQANATTQEAERLKRYLIKLQHRLHSPELTSMSPADRKIRYRTLKQRAKNVRVQLRKVLAAAQAATSESTSVEEGMFDAKNLREHGFSYDQDPQFNVRSLASKPSWKRMEIVLFKAQTWMKLVKRGVQLGTPRDRLLPEFPSSDPESSAKLATRLPTSSPANVTANNSELMKKYRMSLLQRTQELKDSNAVPSAKRNLDLRTLSANAHRARQWLEQDLAARQATIRDSTSSVSVGRHSAKNVEEHEALTTRKHGSVEGGEVRVRKVELDGVNKAAERKATVERAAAERLAAKTAAAKKAAAKKAAMAESSSIESAERRIGPITRRIDGIRPRLKFRHLRSFRTIGTGSRHIHIDAIKPQLPGFRSPKISQTRRLSPTERQIRKDQPLARSYVAEEAATTAHALKNVLDLDGYHADGGSAAVDHQVEVGSQVEEGVAAPTKGQGEGEGGEKHWWE